MKIAAAYIRVSTDDQVEYSPDSQLKAIRDYAHRNGYVIPDEYVFVDEGISGRSAVKRPAFNRMIAIAKTTPKPFEAILLWKFSRFARNREDAIVYKSMLRNKQGIEVRSITESVDDDKMSILIEAMIEAMDEYYSVNLAEEVRRGMTEKASRGEPVCDAAFGYDLIDKKYVLSEEAPIVRQIFEDYLEGYGCRAIATGLANRGVRTKRGNPPDNRFVEYILRNPVYAGKIRWSTHGKAASRRDFDNPNNMIVQGAHEAIVSEDVFNAVQAKLNETKARYGKYQRPDQETTWMLKGLVHCSACGATLVHQSTKTPSMQCHNYARGSCKVSHGLSISKANKAVVEYLQNCVLSMDFKMLPKAPKNENRPDLKKLLENEKRKFDKIKEAYQSGIDTLEEYRENKKRITDNISRIETELTEREAADKQKYDKKAFAKKVNDVLAVITDETASEQVKGIAIRMVVAKIVYKKPEKSLDVFFYV